MRYKWVIFLAFLLGSCTSEVEDNGKKGQPELEGPFTGMVFKAQAFRHEYAGSIGGMPVTAEMEARKGKLQATVHFEKTGKTRQMKGHLGAEGRFVLQGLGDAKPVVMEGVFLGEERIWAEWKSYVSDDLVRVRLQAKESVIVPPETVEGDFGAKFTVHKIYCPQAKAEIQVRFPEWENEAVLNHRVKMLLFYEDRYACRDLERNGIRDFYLDTDLKWKTEKVLSFVGRIFEEGDEIYRFPINLNLKDDLPLSTQAMLRDAGQLQSMLHAAYGDSDIAPYAISIRDFVLKEEGLVYFNLRPMDTREILIPWGKMLPLLNPEHSIFQMVPESAFGA